MTRENKCCVPVSLGSSVLCVMANANMTEGRSTFFLCCPGLCFIDVPHSEGWGSMRRLKEREEGVEKV